MSIATSPVNVLAIGAHPDDIELGAGGYIHRLITEQDASVSFLIFTAGRKTMNPLQEYDKDQRVKEAHLASRVLGVKSQEYVYVLDYDDGGLHLCGHRLIDEIEKRMYGADGTTEYNIVLTHSGQDTHADHREVFEASVSALRYFRGTVLLYQSPSTRPNGFHPTFFVNLDDEIVIRKCEAIRQHISQREKRYMTNRWIEAMASSWAFFHRINPEKDRDTFLEAFEVYKSFMPAKPKKKSYQ
jgi:LmbE family N-acetylglucosaminyl deacetylase